MNLRDRLKRAANNYQQKDVAGIPMNNEAVETKQTNDSATDVTEVGAVDPLAPADAVSQEEFERLKTERDSLIDRLARLQAEFDNARKRETRERNEFRDYAVSGAIEQFLPVLDNFQLALKSTGSTEQLRTGVELIVKQRFARSTYRSSRR
jgi:molecular chaperone GrpE